MFNISLSGAASFERVAEKTGGEFNRGGIFGSASSVTVPFHDWSIVLDTFSEGSGNNTTHYTRVYSALESRLDLTCTVHPEARIFKKLLSFFQQPVVMHIGDEMDRGHEVRGESSSTLQQLFGKPSVQEAVTGWTRSTFEIDAGARLFRQPSNKRWQGTFTLQMRTTGKESDVDTLVSMIDTVRAILVASYEVSNGGATLAPGERPQLQALVADLDRALAWTSAGSEMRANGSATALSSPVSGFDLRGELLVSAPQFPSLVVNVELSVPVPATSGSIQLHTPDSVMDKIANLRDIKVNDDVVDDRFVIEVTGDGKPLLVALTPALRNVAGRTTESVQLRIKDDRLQVRATACSRGDAVNIAEDFVALWKAAIKAAAGVRSGA